MLISLIVVLVIIQYGLIEHYHAVKYDSVFFISILFLILNVIFAIYIIKVWEIGMICL